MNINPLFFAFAIVFAIFIGYWARKYVEKKWPNKAVLADRMVKAFGNKAESAVKEARTRLDL